MDSKKRFLEDVNIIKNTLEGQEGRILLPAWAYLSWAVVVAFGTIMSYLLFRFRGLTEAHLALTVWVPVFIIGSSLETVGWVSFLRKEELVLRAEWFQRMILEFCGIIIGLMAIGFFLSASGAGLAGFFVISLAICFMALGSYSWKSVFIEAYFLLATGIVMLIFANKGTGAYLAAGGICSVGFAIAGIHTKILEQRHNG